MRETKIDGSPAIQYTKTNGRQKCRPERVYLYCLYFFVLPKNILPISLSGCTLKYIAWPKTFSNFVRFNFYNFKSHSIYVENKHLFFPYNFSAKEIIPMHDMKYGCDSKQKKPGDSYVCAQEQYFSYLHRNCIHTSLYLYTYLLWYTDLYKSFSNCILNMFNQI